MFSLSLNMPPQTRSKTGWITTKRRAAQSVAQIITQPLTKFALFPKLPPELRIRVWKFTIEPRITAFKLDNERYKVPSIFYANAESRHEAKKSYSMIDFKHRIISNPTIDILHLDAAAFAPENYYHITAFHTLICKPELKAAAGKFTKISVSLRQIRHLWRVDCLHCFFMESFKKLFPNVTEINIVLRPGPLGAAVEDMWVVGSTKQTDYYEFHMMDVKFIWDKVCREKPEYEEVNLQFVRFEHWEN